MIHRELASKVARDPLAGGLFENLIVIEALKARLNKGRRPSLYYIRGKSGIEIDLVLEVQRRIHAMEIKSASTPEPSFAGNINRFADTISPVESKTVLYSGDEWPIAGGGKFVNFRNTADVLDSRE